MYPREGEHLKINVKSQAGGNIFKHNIIDTREVKDFKINVKSQEGRKYV